VGHLEPGLGVYEGDTEKTVEAQHYACLYYGRGHMGQALPDQCYTDQASYVTLLEQIVVPRHHCTDLIVHLQVNSDAGCDVKVTATPTVGAPVTTTDAGIAAGVQERVITLAGVNGEDQVVTVKIEVQRGGSGTWASVEALLIADDDLGTVPS